MWLLNRLTPSFKKIADFRKDHEGLPSSSGFCRKQSQFGAELLPIDRTKIAAVASDDAKADRKNQRGDRPQDCRLSGVDGRGGPNGALRRQACRCRGGDRGGAKRAMAGSGTGWRHGARTGGDDRAGGAVDSHSARPYGGRQCADPGRCHLNCLRLNCETYLSELPSGPLAKSRE